jgi:hypothetical protein
MVHVAPDRAEAAVVVDVGEQAASDAAVRALGRGGLHCPQSAGGRFPGNVASMNAL